MCSAPWYSNTRWMSFVRPISHRYPTNNATRNTPSAMLTMTPWMSSLFSSHTNRLVGPSTKTATNATIAIVSDTPTWREDNCSSSSVAWFEATSSARTPIFSDCPSTTIPRKNGLRQIACRAAIESMSCDST